MPEDAAFDRARSLERHIMERTWGRVDHLAVEVTDERVRVRGWTRSYYIKQLAIQACLEAAACPTPAGLAVDIEVGEAAPALSH
jgi:hypothetical protein